MKVNIEALFSAIKERKNGLELIVEVNNSVKNEVYNSLRKVGKCTAFEFIPYLTLECSSKDAEKIVASKYQGARDLLFERSLHYALENILSIEISNKVAIPPMRPGINCSINKNRMWNLENIGVYDALNEAKGAGSKIGIIDTGCDYTHPEISGRFSSVLGYDFVEKSSRPVDKNGHGTHVAGTAAGKEVGIARESTLYAIRVLDEYGSGSESDVMLGIEWALKNKLDIVNLSLGASNYSDAFKEMCYYASDHGLVICAAAGNEGDTSYNYPASFEPVISVAAVDKANVHASFSNINEMVDISAPGVDIVSSYPGGGYRMFSGTSMATPHLTGCLALALSKRRDPSWLEGIMKARAEHLENDTNYPDENVFGAGLIRIDRMVGAGYSRIAKKILEYEGSWDYSGRIAKKIKEMGD